MKMKLSFPLLIFPLALAGCALAWQKPYHVDFSSSSSMTINYDPDLTSMGDLQNVAQEHCSKYNKDALPQAAVPGQLGLRSISFICTKRN